MWGPHQEVMIHNPRSRKTGRAVRRQAGERIRKERKERDKHPKGSVKWRQHDHNVFYAKANHDSGLEAEGGKRARKVTAKRARRSAARSTGGPRTKAGRKKAAASVRKATVAWF